MTIYSGSFPVYLRLKNNKKFLVVFQGIFSHNLHNSNFKLDAANLLSSCLIFSFFFSFLSLSQTQNINRGATYLFLFRSLLPSIIASLCPFPYIPNIWFPSRFHSAFVVMGVGVTEYNGHSKFILMLGYMLLIVANETCWWVEISVITHAYV